MLLELNIRNLAIIDSLRLEFGEGLNVFTGETGAGKSIIIDAIDLILGDRARTDLISTGSDELSVEALFDITGMTKVKSVLEEAGIPVDGDDLIVKRVIARSGRNKVYINSALSTLMVLANVSTMLVDIYGQSAHQSLAKPEDHLDILDSFGNLTLLREEMKRNFDAFNIVKVELNRLKKSSQGDKSEFEILNFQLKELEDANIKVGEEEELKNDRDKLKNIEHIIDAVRGGEQELYSSDGSIVERLGSVLKKLNDASSYDATLKDSTESLNNALAIIEDAAMALRSKDGSFDQDPQTLNDLEERLDFLTKLKRKYSRTTDELAVYAEELQEKLGSFDNIEDMIKKLEVDFETTFNAAMGAAERIAMERLKVSTDLKQSVESELNDLGMGGSIFEVHLDSEIMPGGNRRMFSTGFDRVSFFLSANEGEDLKPLAKIASGGELSRIMLALKSVSSMGKVGTMIFDEIDTGVGGRMAHVVGEKLRGVSRVHQVFCITHLPQVAVFGNSHYYVSKSVSEGKTRTMVKKLTNEERIADVAKMLGGVEAGDASVTAAKELFSNAWPQRKGAVIK